MKSHPRHVLIVEDDEIDIKLIKNALCDLSCSLDLSVVHNGIEALNFLNKSENSNFEKEVDLLILDISMPLMNGQELLEIIGHEKKFNHVIKVVLSSSDNERDIWACYNLGANAYICKPDNPAAFKSSLNGLVNFWFDTARLPKRHANQVN